MVCLWFVLLIKDMFTYDASLFHRACPVWIAIVCVIVVCTARVIRRRSRDNGHSLAKTWMPLCFGKQLLNPSAIPTAKLLSL